LHRQAVIAALISLSGLVACTDPPKQSAPNKLQQYESRFWRRPDQSSSKIRASTPGGKRDDGPPLNVENPALPFEVAEKVSAALDIACGENHPPATEAAKAEPVEITPDGEKALLVTVRETCICSASGNCPRQVWTRETDGVYQRTLADDAYDLLLANTVHNGHYDVITEAHLTARESIILRYEWDGKEYHPAEQSCRVGDGDLASRKIVPGKCR
jgi:hypothetical protein